MQVRDAAGAGLVSVPARERNQGSGLSGRGDGRPERAAGLAAGEEQDGASLKEWDPLPWFGGFAA